MANITATRVHADDAAYRSLSQQEIDESIEFLEAHGFGRWVFQLEVDVVDCPLLRVWWLSPDELDAVIDEGLANEVMAQAHVSEVALCMPLPSWWWPEIGRAA